MFGCLIPPTVHLGRRVTDRQLLLELEAAAGKPKAVTALAQRIGAAHGLASADHFHVPKANVRDPQRDEHGLLVAYVAQWVDVE